MGSKTNRNLQAKFLKSRRQKAESMFDVAHTEAMHIASWRHVVVDINMEHARRVERRKRLLAHF